MDATVNMKSRFSRKEHFDKTIVDSALRTNSENEVKELQIHFIYAGHYYHWNHEDKLRSFILERMEKYAIKSVMVTSIYMRRNELITKKVMESYCKGKRNEKDSVNDDLESFFKDLRHRKQPDACVWTYFLPRLTEEELELVERRDTSYLATFCKKNNVEKTEMMLYKSNSKYVEGWGQRKTFTIDNPGFMIIHPYNLGKRKYSFTE